MATKSELDNAISSLVSAVSTASSDCNAAFLRLKTQLQAVNLALGAIVAAGVVSASQLSAFDVSIMFVPGPGQIASLQFDMVLPLGFTFVSAITGPAATAAQKSVQASMVTGVGLRTIVFGLNQTVLSQGLLLTLRFTTDATVVKRLYSFAMTGITASTPAGSATIFSGVSGSVTII